MFKRGGVLPVALMALAVGSSALGSGVGFPASPNRLRGTQGTRQEGAVHGGAGRTRRKKKAGSHNRRRSR